MRVYIRTSLKNLRYWRKLNHSNTHEALIKFLKIHGYVPVPIKNIEHSCCESDLAVFDFDPIKDKISSIFKVGEKLKSCDAIKIEKNKIFLIEMKSYKGYANNPINHGKTLQDLIEKHLQLKHLPTKKTESVMVLLSVLAHYKAPAGLIKFLLDKQSCEILPFLLTDASSRDITRLTLATMDLAISTRRVSRRLTIINCSDIPEFFAA